MAAARVLRVGLTGNIAAGKSTVGAMLEEAGCLVVDLDKLGHELIADPDSPAVARIRERFGVEILDPAGAVDRAALAQRIFSDPGERAALEAILHPRIREPEEERVAAWRVARGIAVTEAALLVETGARARYHRLVVVAAAESVRLDRLAAKGMDRIAAQQRVAAQMPEEAKVAKADYVIDNGGDRRETLARVRQLLLSLRRDLDHLCADEPLPDVRSSP